MRFSDVKMELPYPAHGIDSWNNLPIKYAAVDRLSFSATDLAEGLYRNEQTLSGQHPILSGCLAEKIYRNDRLTFYQPRDPLPWRYPDVARKVAEDCELVGRR